MITHPLSLITVLILGPGLLAWLLVGYIFCHRAPVLLRHAWGAVGAAAAGWLLLEVHGGAAYTWLVAAGLVAGLSWTAAIYALDALRGLWKVRRAEGTISRRRVVELARRAARKE
jgi:hypothetical protein